MRIRVVLIDDEPCVLSALRRLLARRGFEVVTFGSPTEALAKLEALRPDVIVTDFLMPDLTGDRVLEEAARLVPSARRVLLTAAGNPVAAASAFFTKPWDERALIAAFTPGCE